MNEIQRPDLSQLGPDIVAYIESLEAELERLRGSLDEEEIEPDEREYSEQATTINLITLSRDGMAKRTPRHLYVRQRRGGMGVFDLETGKDDQAALLALTDEDQHLVLFSNFGRAFRLPVDALIETAVRGRGQALGHLLPFRPHEKIVAALPGDGGEFAALVSQRGWVRHVRSNYLGKSLIPGMSFHDVKEGGYLSAACWTQGDGDLFMASFQGKGIRFSEGQVPARGCLGMRVAVDDAVVAVAHVYPDSGVFLLSHDGKGTVRLMSGFPANKAPGAGGKLAIKTDHLVGAVTVAPEDDVFVISRLNKIVRFRADEVPLKEGVVQGVNCISLRGDEAVAVAASSATSK